MTPAQHTIWLAGEVLLAGTSQAILLIGAFSLGRNLQMIRDAFAGRPIQPATCREDCPLHGDPVTAWVTMMRQTRHPRPYRTAELLDDFRAFAPNAQPFTERTFARALREQGFELQIRQGGVRAWSVPSALNLCEAA